MPAFPVPTPRRSQCSPVPGSCGRPQACVGVQVRHSCCWRVWWPYRAWFCRCTTRVTWCSRYWRACCGWRHCATPSANVQASSTGTPGYNPLRKLPAHDFRPALRGALRPACFVVSLLPFPPSLSLSSPPSLPPPAFSPPPLVRRRRRRYGHAWLLALPPARCEFIRTFVCTAPRNKCANKFAPTLPLASNRNRSSAVHGASVVQNAPPRRRHYSC